MTDVLGTENQNNECIKIIPAAENENTLNTKWSFGKETLCHGEWALPNFNGNHNYRSHSLETDKKLCILNIAKSNFFLYI